MRNKLPGNVFREGHLGNSGLNVGLGVLDWGQVLDGMRAKRAEKEAKENNKIGDNHDLPGETSGTTIDVEAIKVEDQPNS